MRNNNQHDVLCRICGFVNKIILPSHAALSMLDAMHRMLFCS